MEIYGSNRAQRTVCFPRVDYIMSKYISVQIDTLMRV